MSVALSAISSFGTLLLLSSNTVPPVKSFIVIIKLYRDLILVYRNTGEWRLGEGGGGGRV